MSDKMKFAVLTKAKNTEVHERDLPDIGEFEVLIQQRGCNICTTDYGQWLGLREHQPYPMAGGHEVSGVIVKTGSNVREDLQVGDHVAVTHSFCGRCEQCLLGYTSDCEHKKKTMNKIPSWDGYYGNFGFSNYSVRNENFLVKMNPNLSASEAGFLEPVATVVKGMRKLRVAPTDKIVVIGAGTMGLVNALVARSYGAQVIVTEIMEKKIEVARSMGFKVIDASKNDPVKSVRDLTNGKGVDGVIVAVGVTTANRQAVEMVKQYEGRISFFAAGYPTPDLKIDSNVIHYRKLELIGTYGADIKDFYIAGQLLNERLIKVSSLIEEEVPLNNIQEAFEKASTPGNYRISVLLD